MKPGRPLRRRKSLKPGKPLKRSGWQNQPRDKLRASSDGHRWQSVKRKPLPRESAKRKAERPARARVKAEVLARDGGCVGPARGVPGDCWGPLDCNELVRRGRWRAGYLVPENCVTLCRGHHEWVTVHIAEAKALGLDLPAPPIEQLPG